MSSQEITPLRSSQDLFLSSSSSDSEIEVIVLSSDSDTETQPPPNWPQSPKSESETIVETSPQVLVQQVILMLYIFFLQDIRFMLPNAYCVKIDF